MKSETPQKGGIPARRRAVHLLDQILGEGRLMAELVGAGVLESLDPPDRARAQRLAFDTLRGLERADRVLQKYLKKVPPLMVQNALRMGTVELCQGGAAHGVVNDLVNIVGQHKRYARHKGLVNAVLRKVSDTGLAHWQSLRVPRLPKWLRAPLVDAWGAEAVTAMEAAQFAGAPLDLCAKADPAAVAAMVGGTVLPTGSVRVSEVGQVSGLPGFEVGDWWVQDAAAALPARLLDVQEGQAVLDLCAAPGGKTLQLAARGAAVTAVDVSHARLRRLEENLTRTGLRATVKATDVMELTGEWDRILLDAPCSATGTMRRHPDLPHAKDGSEFGDLIALQTQMLDHAWSLLRAGGQMVFCTCSLLPDEGEVQILEALGRHADMTVDRGALDQPWVEAAWITTEGGLRLRPDYWSERGGMDGFYIAVLRKER